MHAKYCTSGYSNESNLNQYQDVSEIELDQKSGILALLLNEKQKILITCV